MSNTTITGRVAPASTISGAIRTRTIRGMINIVPSRDGMTLMSAVGFAGLAGIHAHTEFGAAHMAAVAFVGFDGAGASTALEGTIISAGGTLAASE